MTEVAALVPPAKPPKPDEMRSPRATKSSTTIEEKVSVTPEQQKTGGGGVGMSPLSMSEISPEPVDKPEITSTSPRGKQRALILDRVQEREKAPKNNMLKILKDSEEIATSDLYSGISVSLSESQDSDDDAAVVLKEEEQEERSKIKQIFKSDIMKALLSPRQLISRLGSLNELDIGAPVEEETVQRPESARPHLQRDSGWRGPEALAKKFSQDTVSVTDSNVDMSNKIDQKVNDEDADQGSKSPKRKGSRRGSSKGRSLSFKGRSSAHLEKK